MDAFDFVYDNTLMSDPNDFDDLDDFDFLVNKWSMKKKKKFVPARQYLHRTGTIFVRILRDSKGCALFIICLNQRHTAGDEQLRSVARKMFNDIELYISNVCAKLAAK